VCNPHKKKSKKKKKKKQISLYNTKLGLDFFLISKEEKDGCQVLQGGKSSSN